MINRYRRRAEPREGADADGALDPHALERLRSSIAKLERLIASMDSPRDKATAKPDADAPEG